MCVWICSSAGKALIQNLIWWNSLRMPSVIGVWELEDQLWVAEQKVGNITPGGTLKVQAKDAPIYYRTLWTWAPWPALGRLLVMAGLRSREVSGL